MTDDFVLESDAPAGGLQRTLIERFLRDTRRGNTEQFVTAFVLLARSLGVNARVASGFVVEPAPGDDRLEISSSDAVIWPEVMLTDGTWVAFDPVPDVEAAETTAPAPEPEVQTPAAPQPPVEAAARSRQSVTGCRHRFDRRVVGDHVGGRRVGHPRRRGRLGARAAPPPRGGAHPRREVPPSPATPQGGRGERADPRRVGFGHRRPGGRRPADPSVVDRHRDRHLRRAARPGRPARSCIAWPHSTVRPHSARRCVRTSSPRMPHPA